MKKTRLLLIDDDTSIASSLQSLLEEEGYAVTVAARGDAGLESALREKPDVVVTDLRLPGKGGLDIVRELHTRQAKIPIVLMTAFGTANTAIEAMRQGAFDYLVKPFEMDEFLEVVGKAAAAARRMRQRVELGQAVGDHEAIIGSSRRMQEVYKAIGRVAATPFTVLIRGESGTGKELVARAIYQHSDRADKPFITVNCAAIPETLLESELFGHERGAFTGAETRRIGRFEQAHGGTLLLDEIGDLTPFTQTKLLRVLQEKVIHRLGGKDPIPVDVRVLAATHRDLEAAIRAQQFREDLYYRLAGVVIELPPLRERQEDIPELIRYLLGRLADELGLEVAAIQPEAVAWLQTQLWPGNVRQLSNVLRQALVRASGFAISLDHVQSATGRTPPPPAAETTTSYETAVEAWLLAAARGEVTDVHRRAVEAAERLLFTRAFQVAQGNQAKAARWLGVARQTVRDKWQLFGLRPPADPPPA